jgi:nitroreductase
MDILTAIRQRRSIRKFKPDPVPEGVIREILESARWSPSWGNTQSWRIHVATGNALDVFKKESRKRITGGVMPSPEIQPTAIWPDTLKKRYNGIGRSVLSALSIERENHAARMEYTVEMFGLFDAPALLVWTTSKDIVLPYAALDAGLILQSVCLLAHSRGLGTCIMAVAVSYPELLRSLLPIPDDHLIVIGAAFGYPDENAPVNHFERERAGLDDITVWTS